MRCRACSASALRPYGAKEKIPLWGCRCGSLNAEVSETDLPRYGKSYEQASFEAPDAVRRSLAESVETLGEYRQLGRWVDIGFGEGALLAEAERLGWQCAGTELSAPSLRFGASRGWDVRERPDSWPDHSFDVVSLMEVLEHVIDPEALLRGAIRLLRPGGALVGTTPNIESLNFRILGIGWSVVAPPEHVTLFSSGALGQLLGRFPLEIRYVRTTGLNPTELMRWRKESVSATERNAGAQRWVQATSNPVGQSAKRFANWVLNSLRAGDSLKVLATKRF